MTKRVHELGSVAHQSAGRDNINNRGRKPTAKGKLKAVLFIEGKKSALALTKIVPASTFPALPFESKWAREFLRPYRPQSPRY